MGELKHLPQRDPFARPWEPLVSKKRVMAEFEVSARTVERWQKRWPDLAHKMGPGPKAAVRYRLGEIAARLEEQ